MPDTIPEINCPELHHIYTVVDELKAEEISAAKGILVAHTDIRKKLSHLSKLCSAARKRVLELAQEIRMRRQGEKAMKVEEEAKELRDPMEKYGVDESESEDADTNDNTGVKRAASPASTETCPRCGAAVERHGTVKICPTCGSAPFEK